jgi:hypothetical protein
VWRAGFGDESEIWLAPTENIQLTTNANACSFHTHVQTARCVNSCIFAEGVQNTFIDFHGNPIESFSDYQAHRRYDIFNNTDCHASPEQGQIFVPPIGTFTYNGTDML